jgi:geranylgeranyl diphosphate synthase, type I
VSLESDLARVEHLMRELAGDGVLGPIVREHLDTGGKRLRARLALSAAQALGAATAIEWAAACELLHNATLVHDDLQDGDQQRRGAPTVWVKHGAAHAINAGDLLFALPHLALSRLQTDAEIKTRLSRVLAERTAVVIRGQAAEQELPRQSVFTWEAYDNAVLGKTSALFELPALGAAILTGRSEELAAPFARLGLLFQMQDDVLDLYGDKGRGRVGADLYEGKVSCLVVAHVTAHPDDMQRLQQFLGRERASIQAGEVNTYIELFRERGALAAVRARISAVAAELRSVGGDLAPLLRELIDRVLEPIAAVLR